MKKAPNTVYIGYDPKENTAYEVLKFTIERIAVDNVRVVPIRRDVVERMGMYTREFDVVDGQTIDKIEENREEWNDETKSAIYSIAETMVELEDKFVDLSFKMGKVEGLRDTEVKEYIRYIADRRLISMGMKGIFKVKRNPLPILLTSYHSMHPLHNQ